jgi:tetratricopeptide (TPR) repeat protein
MIAAAAVMEGAAAGAALEVHALHALKRFPNDPALTMAKAVAAELRAGPDLRTAEGTKAPNAPTVAYSASSTSAINMASVSPTLGPTPLPAETVSSGALDLAVRRFNDLASIDPYRDEAKLRLGYTALRRGKPEDALQHLAGPAKNTTDVFIAYLAHLFRGRALDRLKRWDQAVVEYRAAVAAQPGAQTAELALAAALARSGRRGEAAELADRALARTDASFDPWLAYGQGDFRHWARLIADVRKAIP